MGGLYQVSQSIDLFMILGELMTCKFLKITCEILVNNISFNAIPPSRLGQIHELINNILIYALCLLS